MIGGGAMRREDGRTTQRAGTDPSFLLLMIRSALSALCSVAGVLVSALALGACAGSAPASGPRPVTLVVLGSSTAAGGGAGHRDSAWVARVRAHYARSDGRVAVLNLAQSGYTTFKTLPTGTPTPAGMPTVDTLHNITAALRLRPDAILVNLPSNDRAYGIRIGLQLANFEAMRAAAAAHGVPVWFTTAQPRNIPDAEKRRDQRLLGDSLRARFGAGRIVEAYAGFEAPGDSLRRDLDHGDGVHLNAAGHRLLAARVIEADIPGAVRRMRRR